MKVEKLSNIETAEQTISDHFSFNAWNGGPSYLILQLDLRINFR